MISRLYAPDTDADVELRNLLDLEQLKGFVMLAGAGSGKTTSLVKALHHVTVRHGRRLTARTQQAACITYTEVAAEEIHADVEDSPLVFVSTIHSFLWSLVRPFQRDIAKWVQASLRSKIESIIAKQEAYPKGTQRRTVNADSAALEKYQAQLAATNRVKSYTYGIGGDYAKGVLGHEDILSMVPDLMCSSKLMASVTASKFPYVFVDESQDTFPNVVKALKHVCAQAGGTMCLGFFGDPMQQIYQRGVGSIRPEAGWATIAKPENFRSSEKVLAVINHVRSEADGLVQISGRLPGKRVDGEVFFFLLPADEQRTGRLAQVRTWLDCNGTSSGWNGSPSTYSNEAKILMIEHRMAAKRLGFERLYSAFKDNRSSSLKQAFDEGNAWPLRPFEQVILPISAAESSDAPIVIEILRKFSPALSVCKPDSDFRSRLALLRCGVEQLRATVTAAGPGSIGSVLRLAIDAQLISLDPRLSVHLDPSGEHHDVVLSSNVTDVLNQFMDCDISELAGYFRYIRRESPYSTQHGTKGSEFRKVLVVLDDVEGKASTQYSYEKLFGLKMLSDTDKKNLAAGADSVLERTRRLLYVCVSRAVESLAVVFFTDDLQAARKALETSGLGACGKILSITDLGQ